MTGQTSDNRTGEQPLVLIVDDELSVRLALTLALEELPVRVRSAADSRQAFEVLDGQRVALVLLDKNLPGMNGVELLAKLRERDRNLPVILLTGYASADSAAECLKLGVDGYLEKPFEDIFKVVGFVQRVLARSGRMLAPFPIEGPALAGAESKRAAAAPPAALSTAPAGLRVVLALPAAEERQLARAELAEAGDRVVEARALSELWRVLGEAPADLVLADLLLGGFEPRDLVVEIFRAAPTCSLVVVASRPPLPTLMAMINLGVRSIVERPLQAAELSKRCAPIIRDLRATPAERRQRHEVEPPAPAGQGGRP